MPSDTEKGALGGRGGDTPVQEGAPGWLGAQLDIWTCVRAQLDGSGRDLGHRDLQGDRGASPRASKAEPTRPHSGAGIEAGPCVCPPAPSLGVPKVLRVQREELDPEQGPCTPRFRDGVSRALSTAWPRFREDLKILEQGTSSPSQPGSFPGSQKILFAPGWEAACSGGILARRNNSR